MSMWNDMPGLAEAHGGYIPPPGAVEGGRPSIHGAFPGHQHHPQNSGPNWFHSAPTTPSWGGPASAHMPWANGGATPGPSWANTPGPSWGNPAAGMGWETGHATPGPSWANTPHSHPPPWANIPRQGWGPAGPAAHGGMSPWEGGGMEGHWGREGPPQSAPADLSLSSGFSAMAAPPQESSSGQPMTGTSWFSGGASGPLQMQGGHHGGMMQGGHHGGMMQGGHHGSMMHGGMMGSDWERDDEDWSGMREAWAHQEGLALKRSHSLGQSKGHSKGKQRSNSFGGGGPLQGWGVPLTFDEKNLSPRPDDWRDGYSPRGGIGADLSFSSFFRVGKKSDSDYNDTKKRTLNEVLYFSADRPRIFFDLRLSPQEIPDMGRFRPRSQNDLLVPAIRPEVRKMRLVHARLPWYVDVQCSHAQYVTLYDVLRVLHEELDAPIAGRDFWNEELGPHDRAELTRAFKERCGMRGKQFAREEMLKGVKRVDFLGRDYMFAGLARRGGMWEIKTLRDD